MPEDTSAAGRDAGRERQGLYGIGIKTVGMFAPRREHGARFKDALDEIEEEWGYYPWDIAIGSAMALTLYAGTRSRKDDRQRRATLMKRRTKMLKAVARLRKEYTADGGDRLSVIVVDGPRLAWEGLVTGGKGAAFYLDRYVDLVVSILAEHRWPDPPPWEGADPYRQALGRTAGLARAMAMLPKGANVEKQVKALRVRHGRLRERGESPPPRPDDADPRGWASAVWRWLLEAGAAPDRRRPLPPPLSAVVDVLVIAGGKLQYGRRDVDPVLLERLRQALPPADLAMWYALGAMTSIVGARGIQERVQQAVLEPPAGPPPDPDLRRPA